MKTRRFYTKLKKKIAVVVLYYNKIRLTTGCIQSIADAGYPPQQVYCFDNGSKPEIYNQLTQAFPLCHHLRIEENLGFSGGFNRALEWVFSSGLSSALFCTNDTLIEPGAAEECESTALRTGAGMAAPLVTYLSRTEVIDSTGAYFNAHSGTIHHYHEYGLPDILDPRKDYIPGTAVWIHRDAFKELGGTDESFHMYWEDVDMCFRAHQKGIPLARCYNARLKHGGGQTCRKKPLYTTFYFQRNRIRFCRRYLEGDTQEKVLRLIQKELTELGIQWNQKGDNRRMGYLKQLQEEFKN